jgi:hypothetical protein
VRATGKLSDVIKLPVRCTNRKCGMEFLETVHRLQEKRQATCPYCHTRVDASSDKWRAYVDEFAEACDKFQVPYHSLG